MIVHNKFVFAHLTKTGGTFIRQYLSDYISDAVRYSGGKRLEKHDGLNVLSKFILNDKFTFGCIRNPLSFYVSLWELIQQNTQSNTDQEEKYGLKINQK